MSQRENNDEDLPAPDSAREGPPRAPDAGSAGSIEVAKTAADEQSTLETFAGRYAELRVSSGVMTDPRSIKEYEAAAPGYGAKVLDQFFAQTIHEREHRQQVDLAVLKMNHDEQLRVLRQGDRGQWMALVVALAGFMLVAWLAWIKEPVLAGLLGSLDLLGLVSVFIYGRKKQTEESLAEGAETTKSLPESSGAASKAITPRGNGGADGPPG